eukprot:GGOE01004837.1.p2 GENE.GGOE01004837.1~~GGOE01004837.1.p2  ORF type:complete len:260 (-),score=53.76 GGOE01004837.1:1114-1863(-)
MAPSVHGFLVLSPRNTRRADAAPSPSPCLEGTSARLRRGVASLFRRLRPSRHNSPRPVESGPPDSLMEVGAAESPTTAIARYLAGRAAAVFEDVDDEALLNYRGTWRMQLDGLEELNRRDEAVLGALFLDPASLEGKQWEAEQLSADLTGRRRNVTILQLSLRLVETELTRRGIPLVKPEAENGLVDVPDDANLCQYCLSRPANTEFTCCHHTGACADCAAAMLEDAPRCPHCRAPNPIVLLREVGKDL